MEGCGVLTPVKGTKNPCELGLPLALLLLEELAPGQAFGAVALIRLCCRWSLHRLDGLRLIVWILVLKRGDGFRRHVEPQGKGPRVSVVLVIVRLVSHRCYHCCSRRCSLPPRHTLRSNRRAALLCGRHCGSSSSRPLYRWWSRLLLSGCGGAPTWCPRGESVRRCWRRCGGFVVCSVAVSIGADLKAVGTDVFLPVGSRRHL